MSTFNNSEPFRSGRWEIDDFPGIDENGDFGLVTKMRVAGPQTRWQPYDAKALAADRAVTTGRLVLDQDVWWTGKDGITCAIDDLTDDRRRFIARMLITNSARLHANYRARQIINSYWSFADHSAEKGWSFTQPEPTAGQVRDQIRSEQERGDHLAYVRNSALFQRMTRDLDWTHPAVTGTGLDIGNPDREQPEHVAPLSQMVEAF